MGSWYIVEQLLGRFWRVKRKPVPGAREPRAVAEPMVSAASLYTIKFRQHCFSAVGIYCRHGWCVGCQLLFIVVAMQICFLVPF